MPHLFLRDIPDDLFNKLQARANRECRSMQATTILLLAEALAQHELREKHREAMNSIIERTRAKQPLAIDSLAMLREDRSR